MDRAVSNTVVGLFVSQVFEKGQSALECIGQQLNSELRQQRNFDTSAIHAFPFDYVCEPWEHFNYLQSHLFTDDSNWIFFSSEGPQITTLFRLILLVTLCKQLVLHHAHNMFRTLWLTLFGRKIIVFITIGIVLPNIYSLFGVLH